MGLTEQPSRQSVLCGRYSLMNVIPLLCRPASQWQGCNQKPPCFMTALAPVRRPTV